MANGGNRTWGKLTTHDPAARRQLYMIWEGWKGQHSREMQRLGREGKKGDVIRVFEVGFTMRRSPWYSSALVFC